MNRRVPVSFVLPFGYDVRVQIADTGDSWGLWDDVDRVILIDQTLKKPAQRRWAFEHELEHAIITRRMWVWQHVGLENPDGEVEEPECYGCAEEQTNHNPGCPSWKEA